MRLGEARTPDRTRIYAIGDVHGCDDQLAAVHAAIADDLADRPIEHHRVVHVGDYVDRGPDSAGALGRLADFAAAVPDAIFLRGNHEDLLLGFLNDPVGAGPMWLANGADATLASYGLAPGAAIMSSRDFAHVAERFAALMPPGHRRFLEAATMSARVGDYFFCHAGIRPGVALDEQQPDDLLWIREEFLFDGRDFGVVVVHGHTPVRQPDVRPNRIDIDTGAVFGGPLTCLVLEGTAYRFL